MKVAIVIPAYNEAATIERVVRSVASHGVVIVVDDCSSDGTGEMAQRAGAVVVRHEVNRGYDGALQSGFERADELDCQAVITFDADGQHDPRVLKEFKSHLAGGEVKLVVGVRPHTARWSEKLYGLYADFRFGVPDILCGLKGYHIDLYRCHGCFDSRKSIGTELTLAALQHGTRHALVNVPIYERQDQPRFGSVLKANFNITWAMVQSMFVRVKRKGHPQ